MNEPQLDRHVQRVVGLAALRRLHRMVAAENAHEAARARWSRRLAWTFLAAAAAAVAWLAFR